MAYLTPITRTYIDTRLSSLATSAAEPLPLLTTLPQDTQTSITRFFRVPDRLMSLASALLKYHFIHTTAKLPWSAITISRTPAPHSRPYWAPPDGWEGDWGGGLEFNVSHQAGLTCLIGCRTPERDVETATVNLSALSGDSPTSPRLGVDIACTHEAGRTPRDITTPAQLASWIDVFAEMFSAREREEMKLSYVPPPPRLSSALETQLRRFYTAWALKEAIIKLVGEGLLADWLREVEFLDVRPPSPIAAPDVPEEAKWTPPESAVSDFRLLFRGQAISEDDIKMDVVAFEEAFVVAVAIRGVVDSDQGDNAGRWLKLDIERDIRPCAEGRCGCLR